MGWGALNSELFQLKIKKSWWQTRMCCDSPGYQLLYGGWDTSVENFYLCSSKFEKVMILVGMSIGAIMFGATPLG